MTVTAGEWVRTRRHGHHGLVLAVYPECPETDLWRDAQTDITDEDRDGQWSLLAAFEPEEAVSVVVPVSDCEPADPIPFEKLPDRLVIEGFGPTEEEAAQIRAGLGAIEGGHISTEGRLLDPFGQLVAVLRQIEEGDEDG